MSKTGKSKKINFNPVAKDLRTPKYKSRVIKNKKKAEELKRLKNFYRLEYLRWNGINNLPTQSQLEN